VSATVLPGARQIKGPSALGTGLRRCLRLTVALAVTDFKLRFFGSVLGYLWQLMRPLMLFGVLYVVFTQFLDIGGDARFFPVALLLGIVLFQFFSEATGASVRSIAVRENLVRKIEFPRLAVPASVVLTALFNLSLNLIPVVLFLLLAGGEVRLSWLQLPVIVLLLAVLAFGLAMLLSALFVRYRDIEPIWDVVLQVLFYGSPILYTLGVVAEKAGDTVARLLMFNPFAALMQQARHAFVDPSHVSAAQGIGGAPRLLLPLGIIVVVLALGSWYFTREAPRIAENL
jgi:ABC-2 type transport system permease protein